MFKAGVIAGLECIIVKVFYRITSFPAVEEVFFM